MPKSKTNKQYIIAFDLDGTLLNDQKEICQKTKDYITKLSKLGHKIILVSGRSKNSMMRYYNELKLDTPLISFNGACISFPNNEKEDICYTIPKELIKKFISKFDENTYKNIMAESNTTAYYLKENKILPTFFSSGDLTTKIGSFHLINEDLLSIIFLSYDESRNDEMTKYLKTLNYPISIRFWHDMRVFGEFYHYDVNKASSLKKVVEYYNLDNSSLIAFGDAPNDIEMLEYANLSFAMKNAYYLVKEHSKYITTKDNNHDGIYYSLKKIIK